MKTNGVRKWVWLLVLLALSCGGDENSSTAPDTGWEFILDDVPEETGEEEDLKIQPEDLGNEPDIPQCDPGPPTCANETTIKRCDNGWVEVPCANDQHCVNGECLAIICSPGSPMDACATPNEYLVCDATGTGVAAIACGEGLQCYEGKCMDLQCQPGNQACHSPVSVKKCRDDGSGWDVIDECEKGGACNPKTATCSTACEIDIKSAIYRGCEYFAVDLDNVEGGKDEALGLVISVPSTVGDATVTITDSASKAVVAEFVVAAGTLKVLELPKGMDLDGSIKAMRSFRIQTTTPATVHQFNPLNGDGVFTNDGSLLLPTNVLGTRYFVMSWPHRQDDKETLRGFATVVATEEGTTSVLVIPRADVVGGGPGSGVAAAAANSKTTYLLQMGEVLNLETAGPHGSDLTGTYIKSDKKIAVFGGHECGNVPLEVSACDHLEQQLLPTFAWGYQVLAAPFKSRSPAQFDVWRVMGGAPNVKVTTSPPQPGYETFTLHEGTEVTFASSAPFAVNADGPILVGHYLTGSAYPGFEKTCGHTGIGDPAFTLAVPVQQYLKVYTLLTPPGYSENYLNIVFKPGTEIALDGKVLSPVSVPVGEWQVAQIEVEAGVHMLSANDEVGLTAYGYDCDVSYAFPGGLKVSGSEKTP
ncbi:MAG TPA: hypothetical protein EYN66_14660 [Myxococcales bacterium]|nr:hypothetical protein [Myxococcales bacterium]